MPPAASAEPRAADGMARANLRGLLENLVTMGLHTSVKVIDVATISASTQIADALQLQLGDAVQKAVRVRSTREGPLSHITTYVPNDIARKFGAPTASTADCTVMRMTFATAPRPPVTSLIR